MVLLGPMFFFINKTFGYQLREDVTLQYDV